MKELFGILPNEKGGHYMPTHNRSPNMKCSRKTMPGSIHRINGNCSVGTKKGYPISQEKASCFVIYPHSIMIQ